MKKITGISLDRCFCLIIAIIFCGSILTAQDLKSRPQGNEDLKLNGTFAIPAEASLRNSPAVSMIISDLNGDGINELVTGRRNGVSIQMGDINAFAPKTQAAFEAIRDLRFISPFKLNSRTIELPISPDFLLSGDFDRDSRMDIAAAARGGTSIYLIEGDGDGGYRSVREIQLAGRITSLASGDTNRLDGLRDIIAGLDNDGTSSLAIYQGLGDIFNAAPETIELASPATQILTGQFDESTFSDIAVTSGNRLIIFSGHEQDSERAEPLYLRQGFNISGMASGDFIPDRDYRSEFALLGSDGNIRILSRGDLDTRPVTRQELLAIEAFELQKQGMPIPKRIMKQIDLADLKEKPESRSSNAATWDEADSFFGATPGEAMSSGAMLTSARLTNRAGDDLILIDRSNKSVIAMPLIVNEDGEKGVRTDYTGKRQAVRFDLDGAPISLAADRLNFDGEKDLIILEEGKSSPTTLISAPLAAFTVNNAGDAVDANPGNGVCATAGAVCTLRAAIMEANHLAGTDSITINAGINITLSTGNPDNDANGPFNFEGGGDLDITCAVNAGGDTCNAPLATNVNNLTITGAAGGNTIAVGAFAPFAPLTSTTDRVFDIGFDGLFGGGFGAGTGLQVTMSNLTIQSGNVREDFNAGGGGFGNFARGGAIRLDGFGQAGTRGTLTLTSVTINNNQADHNSGGIFNQFSNVSISSSTVSNNIGKAGPGGGLQFAASTPATLSVSGSTFSGNEARTGPIFMGTAIDVDGGGIYATLDNNTATITSTNFTNNISHDDGGAVYVASGATTVTGGTISGNTARDDGGAFAGDNDTVSALRFMTLSGATMQNNRANSDNIGGGDGGAIFRDRGTLNVTNCTIGGVAALQPNNSVNGGGIAHAFRAAVTPSNQTTINIDNGSITGNNATTDGGGVFINATNQNVGTPSVLNVGSTTSVSVTENNSRVHGGGFAVSGGVTDTLTRATFSGNDADSDNNASGDGGGLYHNNSGGTTAIASTVSFTNNGNGTTTTENGGAIHHSNGTLTLNSPTVSGNDADVQGGGLFVSGGIVNVNGVTFSANTFPANAAEVRLTGGTTNFSNTIGIPGELSIAGGILSAGSSTVNLGEDFHFSSGTFTAGASQFIFNGTGAQQIYGAATPTFNQVFISNTVNTVSVNNNTNAANVSVITNATLQVSATRTLTVSGILGNSGTIKGTGTIVNNFINPANGIVAPGLSPGILSFTGTFANMGNYNVEIGGTGGAGVNPNGHDQLLVSGTANLGGTLNVTLTNAFTPAPGNSFLILDAANSTGTFATTNLPNISPNSWSVTYNNAAGTVTLVVVAPAPTNTPTNTPTATSSNTPTPTTTSTHTPTATATSTNTPTATPTGSGSPSVGGTVTYGNPASPTTKFISNATVTGTGSPNVFTTTAAPGGTAGQYTLNGFGAGSYTVSPSKSTGQNGIASADAARVAQHVSGNLLITTDRQRIAADVTNNGVISSTDAAQIARFVSGLGPPIGLTGQWRFFVPDPGFPTFPIGASPTTRVYNPVSGNLTGQDYIGILIGETTGNWAAGPLRPAGGGAARSGLAASRKGEAFPLIGGQSPEMQGPERGIAVGLPSVRGSVEKEIVIPVSVRGVADKGIISYEFDLRYDPAVIQPLAEPVDVAGTVSRGLSVVTNASEPGLLRVVVYGAFPIDSDGVLLNLRFTTVGAAGSVSSLAFERIMFNEGDSLVMVTDGRAEVLARSE
ncbi:MAG: cohesin domain-containing protein [Pyrinomonadaceae bacterium]